MKRRHFLQGIAAMTSGALPWASRAQDAAFPNKAIRIVAASAPGALLDVATRLYAEQMAVYLKQPVVVENLAGAGSVLAARQVARATADGYTLMSAANTLVTVPLISKKAGYTLKDFVGVGEMVRAPSILVVGRGSPFKTLADLVAAARTEAGKVSYASAGVGTTAHLPVEMFAKQVGITLTHVPYKGVAAAVPDVAAGRADFMMGTSTSFSELMKSGGLRALAVATDTRSPAFPDVPTFKELGYPGVSFEIWVGIVAPAGIPKAVRAKLGEAMAAARADQGILKRLESIGQTISPLKTPEQFDAYFREEEARYQKLIKEINLSTD